MQVINLEDWRDLPENYTGIVEYSDGTKQWCLNGKWHREDGPAIEWADGNKFWCLNGELLFWLLSEFQPFILLEEFVDEEGKKQIKVLTQNGTKIWKNLPGLKELADNWEKKYESDKDLSLARCSKKLYGNC